MKKKSKIMDQRIKNLHKKEQNNEEHHNKNSWKTSSNKIKIKFVSLIFYRLKFL